MNKSLSFALLDFRLIKPYRNSILMVIAMSAMMSFIFRSPASICSYIMMMLSLTVSYPFSIGDKNGTDTLYSTLAVSRKNIVMGRYCFALLVGVIGMALSFAFSLLVGAVFNTQVPLNELTFPIGVSLALFVFVVSVQYPIYFKLGYTKAKFIAFAPLAFLALGTVGLASFVDLDALNFSGNALEAHPLIYAAFAFLIFLLLALSYALSRQWYAKRDL